MQGGEDVRQCGICKAYELHGDYYNCNDCLRAAKDIVIERDKIPCVEDIFSISRSELRHIVNYK
jgi:hypothetical protein